MIIFERCPLLVVLIEALDARPLEAGVAQA
jgi:hypothetical protein